MNIGVGLYVLGQCPPLARMGPRYAGVWDRLGVVNLGDAMIVGGSQLLSWFDTTTYA